MAGNEKSEKESNTHEKIQERMRNMQDSVDNTLIEIQNLISDIENPFTLLGKMAKDLGKDKVIKTKIVDEEHRDPQPLTPQLPTDLPPNPDFPEPDTHNYPQQEKPIPPLIPTPNPPPLETSRGSDQIDSEGYPAENVEEDTPINSAINGSVKPQRRMGPQSSGYEGTDLQNFTDQQGFYGRPESYTLSVQTLRFMDAIALSEFLLSLFGRDSLYDILQSYLEIGMADEDSVKSILKAIDLLTKNVKNEPPKRQRPLDADDLITAIYLLEIFSKDSSGLLYLLFRHLNIWADTIDGRAYDDKEDLR